MVAKLSYLIIIVYIQLYGFKHTYLKLMIYRVIWCQVFLSHNNDLYSHMVSSIPI